MTLQDSITAVTDSLQSLLQVVNFVLFPVLSAVIIFTLGIVISTLLKNLWLSIFTFLSIEKSLQTIPSYKDLVKTHKRLSISNLTANLIWWSVIITFSIPVLESLGVTQAKHKFFEAVSLLPAIILPFLVFSLGVIFSTLAHQIIIFVGHFLNLPSKSLLANLLSFLIVLIFAINLLSSLGIDQDTFRFLTIGSIAGLSLGFGLGSKELISTVLKKVKDLVN